MSYNDLMSDYVARINNANMVNNEKVVVRKNNLVTSVSKKLVTLGYLKDFEVVDNNLSLTLNTEKIDKLIRVSKPGHRKYHSFDSMPRLTGGIGFLILTTSKGIKTQVEAHKEKVGGEVLFSIV
jgi:small subunit ribosomal protein S8